MRNKPLNEFAPPSAEPQTNLMPPGEVDHEGAMAKADLYKLANYSVKLFKKIQDEDQLESWVQAKITKAADYIASVYHYLEYEMKFSEYGAKLEISDVYSESEKRELLNKLTEAKELLKALKVAQAQKLEEAKSPKAKKDYDKDGKIESEKDEVIGSRRKAAGLDESWDDDDEDDDVKRADSELKKRGVKLPKTKADPDKDMSKLAKKSKKEDDLDESWDDDDEDDDVKRADSELKKRGVKLPKVKHKEVPIKKTAKDKEEELDESWDDDDEDDDVKRADSELKKRGVKLPKVKHKEVPIKKTAKDKEEELHELSHATLKSYAEKKGDQMFKQKKPASGQDLTNYRKAIDKMHKKEDDGELNETSEAKKKSYRDAAGKDMQKAAKEGDKATVSKRLKGVSASLKEGEKPSSGLSAKQKSATVKKAKAGGDIGKPGKGFEKVAKAAGGGEKGKKIAAAAMWKNIKRESVNEGRRGGPIDNFTGDDISNLLKMNDLEAMKARAVELIQTPSAKPIKPEKVQYYLHQIDKMTKPVQILELMYNMLLGGEGHGVIGSKGSMSKNSYRSRFDEWGGDPATLDKGNSMAWDNDPDEEFYRQVDGWYDDIKDSIDELGVQFPVSPETEDEIVEKIDSMWGHGVERPNREVIAQVVRSINDDSEQDHDADAYDENDPKHPNWAQRQLDNVDLRESAELDAIKSLTKRLLG